MSFFWLEIMINKILINFEKFIQFQRRLLGLYRVKIPINNIRSPFGEPFNKKNHWVKTLDEYDNGIRDFRKTSLYNYHKNFCPKSIFQILKDIPDKKRLELYKTYPLGNYPWSRWVQPLGSPRWERARHCGPSSDNIIENEYKIFVKLYKKIRIEGFKPSKYGYPVGLLLIDNSDKINIKNYCIMLGGNHRTAIAYHLKKINIKFRLFSRFYIDKQVVCYSDLHKLENDDINYSKKLFKEMISEKFKY